MRAGVGPASPSSIEQMRQRHHRGIKSPTARACPCRYHPADRTRLRITCRSVGATVKLSGDYGLRGVSEQPSLHTGVHLGSPFWWLRQCQHPRHRRLTVGERMFLRFTDQACANGIQHHVSGDGRRIVVGPQHSVEETVLPEGVAPESAIEDRRPLAHQLHERKKGRRSAGALQQQMKMIGHEDRGQSYEGLVRACAKNLRVDAIHCRSVDECLATAGDAARDEVPVLADVVELPEAWRTTRHCEV